MPIPSRRRWKTGPGVAGRTGLYDRDGKFIAEFNDQKDADFAVFAERNLEPIVRGLRNLVVSLSRKKTSNEIEEARTLLESLGVMFFPEDRVKVNTESGNLWFIGTVLRILSNGVEVRADDNDQLFHVAYEQLNLLPPPKR